MKYYYTEKCDKCGAVLVIETDVLKEADRVIKKFKKKHKHKKVKK